MFHKNWLRYIIIVVNCTASSFWADGRPFVKFIDQNENVPDIPVQGNDTCAIKIWLANLAWVWQGHLWDRTKA